MPLPYRWLCEVENISDQHRKAPYCILRGKKPTMLLAQLCRMLALEFSRYVEHEGTTS